MFYLDIKNKRISKHLTQKQLSKRLHISQSYLSKLEHNINLRSVKLGLIEDLAKELNCKGDEILKYNKQD